MAAGFLIACDPAHGSELGPNSVVEKRDQKFRTQLSEVPCEGI